MPSIFGRAVILPLTNKSGGALAKGDVVIIDTSNNEAVTTTTTSAYTGTIGVVVEENGIANNAVGRVQFSGYVALVNVNASVTRGNFGKTHTVAKQGTDGGASRGSGVFCQFLTGGTTPTAILFGLTDGSGVGLSDPMTTRGDIIVRNAANATARLALGANHRVLRSDGSDVAWDGGAWTSYTPTLSASPTPPTIGNGTLVGAYKYLDDKTVAVRMSWAFGSTSNAGSGGYSIALPFAAVAGGAQVLAGHILDSGTAYFVAAGLILASGSTFTPIAADGTGSRQVSQVIPMTWANGDTMGFEGIYEIA